MKEIKSNWNNLEAVQHIGRVPKRGVSKPVSNQRYVALVASVGKKRADIMMELDRLDRRPNVSSY
jgi:hypothetical protein